MQQTAYCEANAYVSLFRGDVGSNGRPVTSTYQSARGLFEPAYENEELPGVTGRLISGLCRAFEDYKDEASTC
jgi:hypothetical protein